MRAVASRGIDVRLLLPRRGDPPAAGWATRAAYEPLLASGVVRIFEFSRANCTRNRWSSTRIGRSSAQRTRQHQPVCQP